MSVDGPRGAPGGDATTGAPAGDRVEIRGLRLDAVHGVLDEERTTAQPFELDLDLYLARRTAASSDDLADTADYAGAVDAAVAVMAGPPHRLLESLSSAVAEAVLADPALSEVTVTVRKLRPPLDHPVASTAVRVHRHRITTGPASGRVFVGVGSNIGDRRKHLRGAVAGLPGVVAVSQVYETEPLGGPPGQRPYLNLVVELDTDLAPRQLLDVARGLEAQAGRRRTVPWGPRSLDVDILLVGDAVVDEDDLVVPHPRMWQRRFVVEPLAELAPGLVPDEVRQRAGGQVRAVGRLTGY
jgi:dihydroneopterin aldolase/2-amino-4-hydroxy-6-hydroxymethyldihydropteridine diphosphokinase